MATTSIKTPNNDAVAKMAALIVNKEITAMVARAGLQMGLMHIGALLQLVDAKYRAYFDAVDQGEIHLDQVQKHFSPEVWAAFPNAKRRQLETAIKKDVERVKKDIQTMTLLLRQNEQGLTGLGPKGQAALELVRTELMGVVPTPVPALEDVLTQHLQLVSEAGDAEEKKRTESLLKLLRKNGRAKMEVQKGGLAA